MQVAILGLETIGKAIAEKLLLDFHEVTVWNRNHEMLERYRIENAEYIVEEKLRISYSIDGVVDALHHPRVFWVMQDENDQAESVLQEILTIAEVGDIVIDAGETYFKNTQRHNTLFSQKGVKFVDIGIAGGALGVYNGFSLMVGGSQEGYEFITPLLDSLMQPNGLHVYLGESGAGHYARMVHDAIAFVMLEAIGEGMGLLSKSPFPYAVSDVIAVWQSGGLIAGYPLDLLYDRLQEEGDVLQTESNLSIGQAVKRVVEQGREERVQIELIDKAIDLRARSQYDSLTRETIAAKIVAAIEQMYEGKKRDNTNGNPH